MCSSDLEKNRGYNGPCIGLNVYGIEIDDMLVDLQNNISKKITINFNSIRSDAVKFDYNSLGLTQPAFFIGGLPQMGGDVLASEIISNLDNNLKEKSCMVLTGSYSEKYSFSDTRDGGWKKLIDESGLKIIKSNSLQLQILLIYQDGYHRHCIIFSLTLSCHLI